MILPIFLLTFYVVSVVQWVTAWVAGVPVLKLVTETSPSSNTSSAMSNQHIHRPASSLPKSQKRRADSLEDEEMYAKVRKGDPYVRNARQEQELSQLKEGGLCDFWKCIFFKKTAKSSQFTWEMRSMWKAN